MATDWNKLKVVDLKAELKRRSLPQSGLKQELIARLNASDAESPTSDEQLPSADPSAPASAEPTPVAEEITARTDVVLTPKPPAGVQAAEEPSAPTPPPETNAILSHEAPRIEEVINVPAVEVIAQAEEDAPSRQETPGAVTSEIIQDAQKRKRRSSTPTPSVKRVRPVDEQGSSAGPDLSRDITPRYQNGAKQAVADEPVVAKQEEAVQEPTHLIKDQSERGYSRLQSPDRDPDVNTGEEAYRARVALSESRELGPRYSGGDYPIPATDEPVEEAPYTSAVDDQMIEPSIHPATNSLYIKNLMRPLRAPLVQDYLVELATPPGKSPDPNVVLDFYLDQVRTHAFVQFQNIASAARVRSALHDQVWPDERNRKALWVDFIPPEKVREWTEEEKSGGRGNFVRWEVIYDQDEDGVIARLEEVGPDARPRAPAIPVAPRQAPPLSGPDRLYPGIEAAPKGPRNLGGPRLGPGVPRSDLSGLRTQSNPPLVYQPVSEELANRRIDNIYYFVSKHAGRNVGGEMNRYTFENGDSFVDRGKEVFIGIRPPHRERERRERGRRDRMGGGPSRRGGGGGPPSFPRGDRYFGDREPVRDDYYQRAPPARFNEDRYGRADDDRRPRYRDFRDERASRGNYGDSYRSRR